MGAGKEGRSGQVETGIASASGKWQVASGCELAPIRRAANQRVICICHMPFMSYAALGVGEGEGWG